MGTGHVQGENQDALRVVEAGAAKRPGRGTAGSPGHGLRRSHTRGVQREIGGVNILKKYASQLCLFLEFTSIVAHPFPATRHGRAGARGMKPTTGLDAVLHVVPAVEHAFGYGSGVFAQPLASWDETNELDDGRRVSGSASSVATRGGSTTMVDYVFAVSSPVQWHAENMRCNPSHYAPHVRLLGPNAVVAIADRVGVGVHFNTFVPWIGCRDTDTYAGLGPGRATHWKYGVVGLDTLTTDLTDWVSLFLAGRMQKPVVTIAENPSVVNAVGANLRAALARALLTLPEQFSDDELRQQLCGLSYHGDARVWLGAEDLHKVRRIAFGSKQGIDALYRDATRALGATPVGLTRSAEVKESGLRRGIETPAGRPGSFAGNARFASALSGTDGLGTVGDGVGESWGQDKGYLARKTLCEMLPPSVLRALSSSQSDTSVAQNAKNVALLNPNTLSSSLNAHLRKTIARSSASQLLAGAVSTAPSLGFKYACAKFAKSAASRFRRF